MKIEIPKVLEEHGLEEIKIECSGTFGKVRWRLEKR